MNRSWMDQLKKTREQMSQYWGARSKKQKGLFIGTFLFLVAALSTFIIITSHPQYVPLYSGQLSEQEVGDIKAELDKEGFSKYKLSDAGTMIMVPKKDAPNLVVTLASKGYPKDNSINYDVFGSNLSFGASDRQYDILQQQAMQTQVADIIKNVDGIQDAQVILTLPQDSVFVKTDDQPKATASVMVDVAPGVKLDSSQIRALYTLVAHSVPNLPMDNITIMNQYSQTLALQDSSDDQALDKYDQQRKVQQEVQQDIQQNLQSLLGTVLGTDKVYVQTYVKMNFDKEKTEEKLVKPTDNNNDGIIISSQKDTKSSSGTGSSDGGVTGTGSTDVPGYTGSDNSGSSSSDEEQSTINYEVNRINNEITKSPYQIEDITINVGVQPSAANSNKVSKAIQTSVRNIASNVVLTALGHPNLSQQQINQRITIFPHKFATPAFQATSSKKSNWPWIAAAIIAGLLVLGGIIWFILRRRAREREDMALSKDMSVPVQEPDYFAEEELSVENQIKKLLAQRPDDFSKVIRTWLNEEET